MKQGNLFSFFTKKPSPVKSSKSSPSNVKPSSSDKTPVSTSTPTPSSTVTPKSAPLSSSSTSKPQAKDSQPSKALQTKKKNNNNSINNNKAHELVVGCRLSVFWPDDQAYYDCVITSKQENTTTFDLLYDDNETETVDLQQEQYKVLSWPNSSNSNSNSSSNSTTNNTNSTTNNSDHSNALRKRRIIEDSEDEDDEEEDLHEEGGGDESDGSEFMQDEDAEEEEEDDDDDENTWMVTEDEASHEGPTSQSKTSKPKQKQKLKQKQTSKRLKVTPVSAPAPPLMLSQSKSEDSQEKKFQTPPRSSNTNSNSNDTDVDVNMFSNFASKEKEKPAAKTVTPLPLPSTASDTRTRTPANANTFHKALSSSDNHPAVAVATATATATATSFAPPMWTDGVVNPAGSHLHNHLPFLQPAHIKDANQNPPSHPNYNPRTIYVNLSQIERISKSKVSPAQKQWWELKAQYYDTVLLFKTGKFYELFHMDADVGVQVLNFVYMKGSAAHAGFPESAYGIMSARLVNAGYKVARVEQTETPLMLQQRKKKCKTGKKPQVVNREVCSVLTQGTRTFCFLDDVRMLEQSNDRNKNGIGPLLAIREVVSEDGKHVEYGVTLVDAIRSNVTLGQFADDVLRSRMYTLLSAFEPCEILLHGNASKSLLSLFKIPALSNVRLEQIHDQESFPKSTAVDPHIRQQMQRPSDVVQPWNVEETIHELHRRSYFPRGSKQSNVWSVHRWPPVLKACVEGKAHLALSSLGAALFYLQRSLIDAEILSMGHFKAYIPPSSPSVLDTNTNTTMNTNEEENNNNINTLQMLEHIHAQAQAKESGIDETSPTPSASSTKKNMSMTMSNINPKIQAEQHINHLQLDGTTLANLEILNQQDGTPKGSLWHKIHHAKSPHGSRLLRAWLLRPLFQKCDIDRRANAVQELLQSSTNLCLSEARGILSKCPDLERLLSRVHSMGMNANAASTASEQEEEEGGAFHHHPNERAVLYEGDKYTKRKVEDFSKLLHGLKYAAQVMECFDSVSIQSPLLQKIIFTQDKGGCFPSTLNNDLQWFLDNFDCHKAAKGLFEPARGVDPMYDEACEEVVQFEQDLEDYKLDVCRNILRSKEAERAWKYINTKVDSRDKYMIELPVSIKVPSDFFVKAKRGSGAKQVNKYRTPVTEDLVKALEASLERKAEGKARGMQLIFAKFDANRSVWEAAAHATAMLDALGSLTHTSSLPGFTRPTILECDKPQIVVKQGFHPCVDVTHNGGDFIPNDITLGGNEERVLLLSGPNMGGKSTLLRQTCLISVLAQIGCYVPASECSLTPMDRIFTRLGASDRILSGQSTFFVELAETAAALRGATRRSLVIMDELGRGTSTFDGTAIAHATVKHLVERNQCLALFATHYHSLLEDWKDETCVRLGHMECMVEEEHDDDDNEKVGDDCNITFLYTLGVGACPKSFGINVARLAALPKEVLSMAKIQSANFERELNGEENSSKSDIKEKVRNAVERGDMEEVEMLWKSLQKQ